MPLDEIHRYADDLHYPDPIAGYYVGAPAPVLSAIADFSVWFFLWDDRHDRDAVDRRDRAWTRLRDDLHAALDSPAGYLRHADPLVAAFADSITRLRSFLSERWSARFAGHFHPIIDAYDREYRNRAAATVPTIEQYLQLRRLTFGHDVWLDLLEPAAGSELPPAVRESDAYRRAGMACQDFAAWYNDLCSFPKELAVGDVHNLAVVLIRNEGRSPADATTELRRRIGSRVADFLRAKAELLRQLDESAAGPAVRDTVDACLFNMENWFSSVYWFHHESGRYRIADWPDQSRPPYVYDSPPGI